MSTKFFKTGLITVAVFAVGCSWLGFAWVRGNRTYDWQEVPATVVEVDLDRPGSRRGTIYGWETTVRYRANGKQYESIVNEFYDKNQVTVYINPDDPTHVVATRGPLIQHMAPPILLTVVSGLFGIVLLLIALSPGGQHTPRL